MHWPGHIIQGELLQAWQWSQAGSTAAGTAHPLNIGLHICSLPASTSTPINSPEGLQCCAPPGWARLQDW